MTSRVENKKSQPEWKNIHNQFVTLWRIGFFCDSRILSIHSKKSIASIYKYLNKEVPIPDEIVNKYCLDSEVFFYQKLKEAERFFLERIEERINKCGISEYRHEVITSIVYTIQSRPMYRSTKVINDHLRWYKNYKALYSLAEKGKVPSYDKDRTLYDFLKYNFRTEDKIEAYRKNRWIMYKSLYEKIKEKK